METRTPVQIELSTLGTAQVVSALGGVQAALGRVGAGAGTAGKQMTTLGSAAQSAKGQLLALGSRLMALAAAYISVRTAINGASAAIREAANLQKLSTMTGFTARQVAELSNEMVELGLDSDNAGYMILRMARAIGEAATDGGPAREALERLGLSVERLMTMSPAQQFNAVRDALAGIASPAERAARATELFGREALALAPLFAKASGEIQKLSSGEEAFVRAAQIGQRLKATFTQLGSQFRGFWAGVIEAIGPELDRLGRWLLELPVGDWGRSAGALVVVMKRAFDEGRIAEYIALVIEAGFELGAEAGGALLKKAFSRSMSDAIAKIDAALIQFWAALGRGTVTALLSAWPPILATINYAFDHALELARRFWQTIKEIGIATINNWAQLIEAIANGLLKNATGAVNLLLSAVGKLPFGLGVNVPPIVAPEIKLPRLEAEPLAPRTVMTWREQYEGASEYIREEIDRMTEQITLGAEGLIEKFSEEPVDLTVSAVERLHKEINAVKREMDEYNEKRQKEAQITQTITRSRNIDLELRRMESAQKTALVQIEERLSKVSADWRLTEREKWLQQHALLEQQSRALTEYQRQLEELRATQNLTTKEQLDIDQRLVEVRSQLARTEAGQLQLGPAPDSYADQFRSVMTGITNEWGSWAKQLAQSFKSVFEGAIGAVSDGITGLITGTKRWGEALLEIGRNIATTVVGAIVQMGVRWIATQIMMAVFGKALMASSLAAAVPVAVAASTMWATPAYLASVATYGGAAAAGGAALSAGQAAAVAGSIAGTAGTAGFREGGFTGQGPEDEVAGVVHRGEYVLEAGTVKRIGLQRLESLRKGTVEIVQTSTVQPQVKNSLPQTSQARTPQSIGVAQAPWAAPMQSIAQWHTWVFAARQQTADVNPPQTAPLQKMALGNPPRYAPPQKTGVVNPPRMAPLQKTSFGSPPQVAPPQKTGVVNPPQITPLQKTGFGRSPQIAPPDTVFKAAVGGFTAGFKWHDEPDRTRSVRGVKAFSVGGFTGRGPMWQAAGIVHRGEYVFDSKSVTRLGVSALEALRNGSADIAMNLKGFGQGGFVGEPDQVVLGPPSLPEVRVDVAHPYAGQIQQALVDALKASQPEVRNDVRVALFNSEAAALESLRSSRGRRMLVDVLRGIVTEL